MTEELEIHEMYNDITVSSQENNGYIYQGKQSQQFDVYVEDEISYDVGSLIKEDLSDLFAMLL